MTLTKYTSLTIILPESERKEKKEKKTNQPNNPTKRQPRQQKASTGIQPGVLRTDEDGADPKEAISL